MATLQLSFRWRPDPKAPAKDATRGVQDWPHDKSLDVVRTAIVARLIAAGKRIQLAEGDDPAFMPQLWLCDEDLHPTEETPVDVKVSRMLRWTAATADQRLFTAPDPQAFILFTFPPAAPVPTGQEQIFEALQQLRINEQQARIRDAKQELKNELRHYSELITQNTQVAPIFVDTPTSETGFFEHIKQNVPWLESNWTPTLDETIPMEMLHLFTETQNAIGGENADRGARARMTAALTAVENHLNQGEGRRFKMFFANGNTQGMSVMLGEQPRTGEKKKNPDLIGVKYEDNLRKVTFVVDFKAVAITHAHRGQVVGYAIDCARLFRLKSIVFVIWSPKQVEAGVLLMDAHSHRCGGVVAFPQWSAAPQPALQPAQHQLVQRPQRGLPTPAPPAQRAARALARAASPSTDIAFARTVLAFFLHVERQDGTVPDSGIELLGMGLTSIVYRRAGADTVTKLVSQEHVKALERERNTLALLSQSPHFLRVANDGPHFSLNLSPVCQPIDYVDLLANDAAFARQLLDACDQLAAANIVHNDLRLPNLLKTADKTTLIVCDLGFSVAAKEDHVWTAGTLVTAHPEVRRAAQKRAALRPSEYITPYQPHPKHDRFSAVALCRLAAASERDRDLLLSCQRASDNRMFYGVQAGWSYFFFDEPWRNLIARADTTERAADLFDALQALLAHPEGY